MKKILNLQKILWKKNNFQKKFYNKNKKMKKFLYN